MLKGCEKECRKERKLKCGNKNSFVKNPFGTIIYLCELFFVVNNISRKDLRHVSKKRQHMWHG